MGSPYTLLHLCRTTEKMSHKSGKILSSAIFMVLRESESQGEDSCCCLANMKLFNTNNTNISHSNLPCATRPNVLEFDFPVSVPPEITDFVQLLEPNSSDTTGDEWT